MKNAYELAENILKSKPDKNIELKSSDSFARIIVKLCVFEMLLIFSRFTDNNCSILFISSVIMEKSSVMVIP